MKAQSASFSLAVATPKKLKVRQMAAIIWSRTANPNPEKQYAHIYNC